VRATVENSGWLPTQVVARPPAGERARPVALELTTDGELVMGRPELEVGHLAGLSRLDEERAAEPVFFGGLDRGRAQAEWLVAGGSRARVEARSPRAGRVAREAALA
jgi:hypothetical protein